MPQRLHQIKAFLLDLDGTLYLGPRLFSQTPAFLHALRDTGRKRLFLTNNSFRSTQQYMAKLEQLGFEPAEEEILTSGWATIHHILHQTDYRKLYLLGSPGLAREFRDAGLDVVNDPRDGTTPRSQPQAVVLGFDQAFTYERLRIASQYLLDGLPYLATHPDKVCPTEAHPIPDTGSLIAYFAACTGRQPVVIGKPHATMVAAALARTGTRPEETAMVGDRLYTDIRMGKDSGLLSILVLSGETQAADLETAAIQPDLVFAHVGEIADCLTKG
jgi:phosphoglycolate/pyridoxal phosphate phosphatase family enzyme